MAADAIRCEILARQDLGQPVPEEGPVVSLPEEGRAGPLHICQIAMLEPV